MSTAMNKDEILLEKRIQELARISYERDIPVHTDFLSLNEQTIFHSAKASFPPVSVEITGGYDEAERKVVCFLPSYEEKCSYYPFCCVKIVPLNDKFAEALTHRDYLGALLNLGIERAKVGDIVIEGHTAYCICMRDMADFIVSELSRVRHTSVYGTVMECQDFDRKPNTVEIEGSVASIRLDALLPVAFQTSRTKLVPLFAGEKVFVNGRMETSGSFTPREGDLISVRGYGKFRYIGIKNTTKKGRLFVQIQKFV
ncbi:MAG: YlmH/Sll1252 family protein [bacterium]|nr:YlmH/Sll1252 family protein [bacterium]